jgi:hypothetical protein
MGGAKGGRPVIDSLLSRPRRSRVLALLGVSAVAIGAGLASPAAAECLPDPTVPNGTTTCSGTDSNGLRVTTTGTHVRVEPAAIVTNSGAPAIAVDIPAGMVPATRNATIGVEGRVDGGTGTGIAILSGPVPSGSIDFSGTRASVTVAAGGTVTGAHGITVGSSPGNLHGQSLASIDNAGTISGTSGVALLATEPGMAGFTSIINRSTGSIGAIVGPVGLLTNAGTIDGAGRSAFDSGFSFNPWIPLGTLTNSGTIRSNGSGATIANLRNGQPVENSGTISNAGTGAAISGENIVVANSGTGLIASAGAVAIAAQNSLNLSNSGHIEGNVTVGATQFFAGSSLVDSTRGTINGSVSFGSGDDVLIARYTGSPTLGTGISGPISGGGGIDTVRIRFDADTEVATAVVLPAGFERLGLAPVSGVTATLAPAFTHVGPVQMSGSGTIINRGTIQGPGQVLVAGDFPSGPRIVNEGTILGTAAVAHTFAVSLTNLAGFTNSGTISAAGDGVSASMQGPFLNSGTITAGGTALSLHAASFTNSGTIRSTGGTGLILTGSTGAADDRLNSGLIEGAAVGLNLSASFANTGTISSAGMGVLLRSNSVLVNRSGGTISGDGQAIGPMPGSFVSIFNAAIVNAGTINGNVSLASSGSSFPSNNRYFAEQGGVLNGNLALGTGDYLVTELVNTGPGRFAGITGSVTASASHLRFRVREDAVAALESIPGFATLGYELFGGALLTLTGPAPLTHGITLAGTGRVELTADISVLNAAALSRTSLLSPTGFASTADSLAITSRGHLSLVRSDQGAFPGGAVVLGGRDSFTNAGTITIEEKGTQVFSRIAAVTGGASVVNSGTISVGGGIGIRDAAEVINSGSIVQLAAGGAAQGVEGAERLVNSGVIQVDGTAVTLTFRNRSPSLVNSGTIASIAGTAVQSDSAGLVIENQATGSINGQVAIAALGGTVVNAGAIAGTVQLNQHPSGGAPTVLPGVYVAAGGTVAGDVLFGSGNDLFLQFGDASGVSGRIVGGSGFDTFGRSYSSDATVALGTHGGEGFEAELVQARGAATLVTITGAASPEAPLYVGGDGRIVNQAAVNGSVRTGLPFSSILGSAPHAVLGGNLVLEEFRNEGAISDGFSGEVQTFVNTGSIASARPGGRGVAIETPGGATRLAVENSGTISANGPFGRAVMLLVGGGEAPITYSVLNSGLIEANGGGLTFPGLITEPAAALAISLAGDSTGTVVNGAAGRIAATGNLSTAVRVVGGPLDLTNEGSIEGGNGSLVHPMDRLAFSGTRFVAGAIQTFGAFDDVVRNSGTITGSIDLGAGNDRIETSGIINGDVFLGDGDDTLVVHAGAVFGGLADGGNGTDAIEVKAIGESVLSGDSFVNFESLTQTGPGAVAYSGIFGVDTIRLIGGTLRVSADTSLATAGAVAVTGSDGAERVELAGMLLGGISLGAGDDEFVEIGDARATGLVDGGAGIDLYRVRLAGDRTGLSQVSSFERLAVEGSGTLSVGLTQDFQSIEIAGVGLDLSLNGFEVGAISGSDAAERVSLDSDVARIALGGGADELIVAAARLAGSYSGGTGTDLLRLTSAGEVRLVGSIDGFEQIELGSDRLVVEGTLDASVGGVSFAGGAQRVSLADGGRLLGAIDLGAGDDELIIAAGGAIMGSVSGGAGVDRATVELAGERTLGAGTLVDFERLATTGSGALILADGAFAFDRVDSAADLRIAASGSLTASQVVFGGAGNRFSIEGGFQGSVSGGAGTNIQVSNGTPAAPITFRDISGAGSFRMTGGFATIEGQAVLGVAELNGGRLIGLAGSVITAQTITVRQGATFGSAGAVNGSLFVAGTLSPGASPGTMTVNGNVTLAGSSTSLFELTPSARDKLVVNGALVIQQGATLQLVASAPLAPGSSLDLITASGGISGSFTNVIKPDSLFGFLSQSSNGIQLLGQFRTDSSYSPQVDATIRYANSVLVGGNATPALIAAAPRLVAANGATDAAGFARIAPEAYASVAQVAVSNGLTLAEAARGAGFGSRRETPGLFTFGQFAAERHALAADEERGTSRARFSGYGMLAGVGYGGHGWSLGAFAGYLDGRQRIEALGARSEIDGTAIGLHGRLGSGPLALMATAAYAASDAATDRALPDGSAQGRYDLDVWTLDIAASYDFALGHSWALRPKIGGTVLMVDREAVQETGGSAFAAQVEADRRDAAFVDGALTIAGGTHEGAAVRPFASFGLRYQLSGRDSVSTAGFGGGGLGLSVEGARRARLLASAAVGAEADLAPGLALFGTAQTERGRDDRQESVRAGLRFAF